VHARKHFDEGGLARAVVTDEGDDLTRCNVEVDVCQRVHGAERLVDPSQAQQRGGGGGARDGAHVVNPIRAQAAAYSAVHSSVAGVTFLSMISVLRFCWVISVGVNSSAGESKIVSLAAGVWPLMIWSAISAAAPPTISLGLLIVLY